MKQLPENTARCSYILWLLRTAQPSDGAYRRCLAMGRLSAAP